MLSADVALLSESAALRLDSAACTAEDTVAAVEACGFAALVAGAVCAQAVLTPNAATITAARMIEDPRTETSCSHPGQGRPHALRIVKAPDPTIELDESKPFGSSGFR